MPVFRLSTTDPYLNLAQEETLLERTLELGPTLLLWRNDPCVVIGRHQNPWVECDLRRMKAHAVPLVRRTSGGGAVYHDGGNTNFSFIAPSKPAPPHAGYDQERQFRVIVAGLARLGISAWKTQRNDLRVGEHKISGNAFRHTRGRSLHHGTLLVSTDLDLLTAYLSPRGHLIQTRATASVRSTVTNLGARRPGLTHEELWDALQEAFREEYGEPAAGPIREQPASSRPSGGRGRTPPPEAHLPSPDDPEIRERAAELASWEWRYGHTPTFVRTVTGRGPEDEPEIALTVKRGQIVAVDPASSRVRDTLIGIRYDREAVLAQARDRDAALIRRIAEEID